MAFLEWKPAYSVQVDELDRQHRQLIRLINSLRDAMKVGAPKAAVERIVSDLATYTRFHFRSEEEMMRLKGYEGLREHVLEHQRLSERVSRFEQDVYNGKIAVPVSLMQFLEDWLAGHIMNSDMKYAACLSGCSLK